MKKLFTLFFISSFLIIFSQTAPSIDWQNTIGGDSSEELKIIQQTTDGGYILGGTSDSNISGDKIEDSNGIFDYWIVKLDENGTIIWQNTIGGNADDFLTSIQQTNDGGYIVGGHSISGISGDKTENSNGGSFDYWIVKLDENGNIEWQNTIGGNNNDGGGIIVQTADEGYIIGGASHSNISGDKTENAINGSYDYWVVKLNENGNIEWQNTIGGNGDDWQYPIQQTSDGGYIVGGTSNSNISEDKTENSNGGLDYWVLKLDENGNIVWQNTIGGNNTDYLFSIDETTDGGFILGGYSDSDLSGDKTEATNGGIDYWIVKLDSNGTISWQNTIGGSMDDLLASIKQTTDNGYILSGASKSNISGDKTENSYGGFDVWVIKIDELGSIIWQRTIGGSNSDGSSSISKTNNGGYIIGASSDSNISGDKTEDSINNTYDYWVIKLEADMIGVNEDYIQNVSIYPNPVEDLLCIDFEEEIHVEIVDMLGKTVMTSQNKEISTYSLPTGIYLLQIYNNNYNLIETRKFIKK